MVIGQIIVYSFLIFKNMKLKKIYKKFPKLKFKTMNFVTNDFKKPVLTLILDIKDYVDNYINNEEINNDFYENFS